MKQRKRFTRALSALLGVMAIGTIAWGLAGLTSLACPPYVPPYKPPCVPPGLEGCWPCAGEETPPNNPPVANEDSYTIGQDHRLCIATPGVLSNDSDADGDKFSAQLIEDVSNGGLTLKEDGSLTYSPNEGFSGTDSFTYAASDGKDTSNVATVTIYVKQWPHGPTLYWNLRTEPPSLDPNSATDTTSIQVIQALFLGLTDFDDETMEVVPELATDWEVSEDGLIWTFHMRDDVIWTDGTAVTAHQVEYSVKRTLDPATGSSYAYVLWIIEGAEAFNDDKGGTADGVGVKALDNYTVQFTLTQPAGYFPAIAGMWIACPLPQAVVEEYGDTWINAENIVTNGAYELGEWVHEDHLILYKSPTYFDAASVKIGQIHCYMIEEASTAYAMYLSDELDVVDAPFSEIDSIKADPVLGQELYIAPRLCTKYYGFNNEKPPFDNPLVRKAFASAIDREALVDFVLNGGQRPAQTFTCPGIFGHIDGVAEGIGMWYAPERALQFLADAGYPNAKGFPEVTLMHSSGENADVVQFIAQSWEDVLNITVNIVSQEWNVYLSTCRENAPQIYSMSWCADYPDANNWVNEVFNSKSGSNYANYNNPAYDALVAEAARETDPVRRLDLYREAEKLLCATDCAIVPIYYYTVVNLTKPYVVRTFASFGGEHWEQWDILPH